jgi:hypothetical protein
MILERSEHLADLDLQFRIGIDALEQDHSAVAEYLPELVADLWVLQRGARDAGDPRSE